METKPTEFATRWERRKERTRRKLLEAAERMFRNRGFDATTVEEIADAADVAKGTFFNYFESKDSLLGMLLYDRMQTLFDAPPGLREPAPRRIWLLLTAVAEELAPYSHLAGRMFTYAMTHPQTRRPGDEKERLAHVLAALVRQGQEEGAFQPNSDPEIAGRLIASYFFHVCIAEYLKETKDTLRWEQRMQAGLHMIYQGLAAPEDSQNRSTP